MDIYEALYTTRAMRRLKPDPIPYEVQARILDAAIHAPTIGEMWRFVLVDDPAIKSELAPLYRQAFERMAGGALGEGLTELLKSDTQIGRMMRSGVHLAHHFAQVPLLLIGFGHSRDGSVVYVCDEAWLLVEQRVPSTVPAAECTWRKRGIVLRQGHALTMPAHRAPACPRRIRRWKAPLGCLLAPGTYAWCMMLASSRRA